MPYEAKVFSILIASPSDVQDEREIAVRTIQEWNELHSSEKQVVLLPVRWETHTNPEYGYRPQEIINRQIVDQCDLLIGIFWTRLGTSTGIAESGTLEEIDRISSLNKPVMLYFSKANTDPEKIDTDQLNRLREFKNKTYKNALVETFNNQIEFKDKLSKQIERQILRIRSVIGEDSNLGMQASILLEFFDFEERVRLGVKCEINSTYFNVIDYNEIPEFPLVKAEGEDEDSKVKSILLSYRNNNKNYYRELVNFEVANLHYTPFDFWMKNQGSLGAKDLHIILKITSDNEDLDIISLSQITKEPKKNNRERYIENERNPFSYDTSDISKKNSNEWHVTFDLPALQPKREIDLNEPIFIGSKKSCEIKISATIYADSIPDPISYDLSINLNVDIEDISYTTLIGDALDNNK